MDSEKDRDRVDNTDAANDDWLKVLGDINTNTVPEGYKTATELSTVFKINRRQINYLLQKRIEEGLIDKVKVVIDGRITNAYKIKNPSQH